MEEIELSQQAEDAQRIRQKLDQYNTGFAPPDHHESLCLLVRRDGEMIAGLAGGTYWAWMYVELFWVDECERQHGLGSRVLAKAEEVAIYRGCRNAHLETHDFQALEFYRKRGYVIFGELENLPEGHTKYYLRKSLMSNKPG
jgi:ribosomal protein S18 acetylase RimI-like enzyme